MKEKYLKLISNTDEFKTVDVITTSGDIQPKDNLVRLWNWLWKTNSNIFSSSYYS